VADPLDVVALRVEHEGAVVVLVVPAHARRSVVRAAGGEAGGVERVDGRAIVAGERDVQSRRIGLSLMEPEDRLALVAEPDDAVVRPFREDVQPSGVSACS
jgi:hypothetical protein